MLSLALTSGWYYICTSYCTPDKQDIMDKLRKLTCKYQEILLLEEDQLLALEEHFICGSEVFEAAYCYWKQRASRTFCKELRYYILGCFKFKPLREVKIDKFSRSRVENSYNLKHIIQKTTELVNGKTISQALKQTLIVMFQKVRVNSDSRAMVMFFMKEAV